MKCTKLAFWGTPMFKCRISLFPSLDPASVYLDQFHTFTNLSFPPDIKNFPLSPNIENVLCHPYQVRGQVEISLTITK